MPRLQILLSSAAKPHPLVPHVACLRGGGDLAVQTRGGATVTAHRTLLAASSAFIRSRLGVSHILTMVRRLLEPPPSPDDPLVLVLEETQEEVDNWLDLVYTGRCVDTPGLQAILHTMQVGQRLSWWVKAGDRNAKVSIWGNLFIGGRIGSKLTKGLPLLVQLVVTIFHICNIMKSNSNPGIQSISFGMSFAFEAFLLDRSRWLDFLLM